MTPRLRLLWRSVGFRLAFNYAVLVSITMLAALAVVYLQTVGVLHQRMTRQVALTAKQLVGHAQEEGTASVAAVITSSWRATSTRCRAPMTAAARRSARWCGAAAAPRPTCSPTRCPTAAC